MSARTDLQQLIAPAAPSTWEIYPYPVKLAPLEDAAKPVALVIEQRTIAAGQFSPDDAGIPVVADLAVWVVVDATRGDDLADVEELLEDAALQLIRILQQLPEDNWDGTAERTSYDPQKPAYQFTISAAGTIEPAADTEE